MFMRKISDNAEVEESVEPQESTVWDGAFVSRRSDDNYRALTSALASEDWPTLLSLCERHQILDALVQNVVESADSAEGRWSTVLHEAVLRSAPDAVVDSLLGLGALCSVQDARGRFPWQLAAKAGRLELARHLRQRVPELSMEDKRTECVFHGLLLSFLLVAAQNVGPEQRRIRLPRLIALRETPTRRIWFPVVGMMGGFNFWWEKPDREGSALIVEGWSRMDGIIMRWHVTPSEASSV
jgi:hypothetical protein